MYEKELARINAEYAETKLLTEMTLKMLKVVQEQIVVSNEEIEELIKFFQEMEKYNICVKLKKLIK